MHFFNAFYIIFMLFHSHLNRYILALFSQQQSFCNT